MSIEVRRARDEAEHEAALALRHEVFCVEQGVTRALELDGRDPEALHLVAVGHDVVGTCRLLFEGDTALLGRMVVARGARRAGIGQALLVEAEREARAAGARRIALHAQTEVQALYAQAGYRPTGAPFEEAGIPHVSMERVLEPAPRA